VDLDTSIEPMEVLQERLQFRFTDKRLLERALTHRSFGADHNERLEFLGDAILTSLISDLLYRKLRDQPEGVLSRIRSELVRERSLQDLARRLDFPNLLRVGLGVHHEGGRDRPAILADALEAVIGAVYLDGGYKAAQRLVAHLFSDVDITVAPAAFKDPKTTLQEWLSAHRMRAPTYQIMSITGADHEQFFTVRCTVRELDCNGNGQANTRRGAEQNAAAAVLEKLRKT
jgi:ribonuclease-3